MQSERVPLGVIRDNQQFNTSKRVQPKRAAKTDHKWFATRHSTSNDKKEAGEALGCFNLPEHEVNKENLPRFNQKKNENCRNNDQSLDRQTHDLRPFQQGLPLMERDSGIHSSSLSVSMETISSSATDDDEYSENCCGHSTKIFSLSFDDNSPNDKYCMKSLDEYLPDILKYLKQSENRHRSKAKYMQRQPEITEHMRTKLVDWLVEVQDEYKLENETLFLAVAYLDRFLSEMSVTRSKLQLLGTTAMFIASKFEEIYPPDADEFAYITADTYTRDQIVLMERLILRVLGCAMSIPTSNQFLLFFLQGCGLDGTGKCMAMFLCEISLLFDSFNCYSYSVAAAASISLARFIMKQSKLLPVDAIKHDGSGDQANLEHDKKFLSEQVKVAMSQQLDDIYLCSVDLAKCYNDLTNDGEKFLREKYSRKRYHKVAYFPAIKTAASFGCGDCDQKLTSSDISRQEILCIWKL